MKRFLPILLLVFSVGVGAETMDDLVKREGIYYKKFNDVPFTGSIQSKYNSGKVKTGRKDGPWIRYHNTGQLKDKGTYKDGKREGAWVAYYSDGRLRFKGTYKDGEKHGQGASIGRKYGKWKYVGEFKEGKFWEGVYSEGGTTATYSEGVKTPAN